MFLSPVEPSAGKLEAKERGSIGEWRTTKYRKSIKWEWLQSPEYTHRIIVGSKPRVKAAPPSVLMTVRTQSAVEAYFRPVSGENPSVCIRDFITSMGYMHAQS